MSPAQGLTHSLEALGFGLNEARAYAALLEGGPSTGYEVGQRSAIPRSAVYASLRSLVERGAARALRGKPERFAATPIHDVLASAERRFEASVSEVREAAARLPAAAPPADAFSVRGYDRVLEEALRLARSARRVLVVSGWPRELLVLASELHAAHARGVHVVTFSHAELPVALPGARFSYGLAEADLESFWQHRLVLVADDARCLLGSTERGPDDAAVVSEAAPIAQIAVSQVSLDITLLAQRGGRDVSAVMATMLGDRVGRLDSLLARGGTPSYGEPARAAKGAAKPSPPARSQRTTP